MQIDFYTDIARYIALAILLDSIESSQRITVFATPFDRITLVEHY